MLHKGVHVVPSVSWVFFVAERRNHIAPGACSSLMRREDCQWNKVTVPPLSLNENVQYMVGAWVP